MTNQEIVSPITQSFLRIHKAITRGLNVSIDRGTEYIDKGAPTGELWKGYVDYVFSLIQALTTHHIGEDEVAFPALKAALPRAPFNQLISDHQLIVSQIKPSTQALEMIAEGNTEQLTRLVEHLENILALWKPHIRMEETAFSSGAISAAIPFEQQVQINADWGKFSQEHSTHPFLAIPFVLYNLNLEDRAELEASLPPVVRDELLPKEWKPRWAPMKPFLLE